MQSIIDIFIKGGIVMPFILIGSIIGIAIIIERLIFFQRIQMDEQKMIARLRATLEKGHFDEALAICETKPSPITNLMKVGIEHKKYGASALRDAVMDAANQEIPRLEKNLSALGTVGNICPLLGLLGTVLGNIQAFKVLGEFGSAFGDPGMLAKGIAEALISTAAGLIVAIPVIIFYNYLVNRVNHMIIRLENTVNEFVLLLQDK